MIKEKAETDSSLKAPKEFWDKMEKEVKKSNPDYSQEQVDKTIGDIWYNLSIEKRKEIRSREGKTYGKAKEESKAKQATRILNEADMSVAKEILNQLGGNKFIAMIGAKNIAGDAHSLSFRIGKNSSGINYVKITLNAMDTYDIEFGKILGTEYKVVKAVNDIYNNQLQEIFKKYTGMDTHL